MQQAELLLDSLDTQLGRFSETGQLFQLNNSCSIRTNTELGALILKSDTLVEATKGYFDPTLGVVSLVWGFPEANSVPNSNDITEAMLFTGWYERVALTDTIITVMENSYLDFGAIAKGYAVDKTYEFIMEHGATECLVEVGGEIRCGSLTGRTWHIGVRHPRNDYLAGILAVTDGAVATSGDYECFFIEDGIRYSHLIDYRTGYPTVNAASATIIADNCATADAVATAAVVAGPEKAALFSSQLYQGMLIITAHDEDCEIFEFGEIPWKE